MNNADAPPMNGEAIRPLITFALIAYKAEQFVCEAIEGALAQTYSPLEVILSDDASPDKTFFYIKEIAHSYNGPHKLILNRNEINLGIGAHVNRIMNIASGQFVVIAAGDDISLPQRTEGVYEAFRTSGGKAMAVFSDYEEIDKNGLHIKTVSSKPATGFGKPVNMCRHLFAGIPGVSNAWSRRIFEEFGPMLPGVTFEDRVIAFRASLLGEILHIPVPLVRYRRHNANTVNMFHSSTTDAMTNRMRCFREVYINNLQDLETLSSRGKVSSWTAFRCRRIMIKRIRKAEGYLQILSGHPSLMARGLIRLILNGGSPIHGGGQYLRVLADRRAKVLGYRETQSHDKDRKSVGF